MDKSADNVDTRGSLAETLERRLPQAVTPVRHDVGRDAAQILPLWRKRLRLAALLLFVGFAIFLYRRLLKIVSGPPLESAADWLVVWCHAGATAILGLFSVLLFSRQPSSFVRLLAAEVALFGFPTLLFLFSQYFVSLRSSEEFGYFAFSGGPCLLLIFVYALYIPSTLPRATVVIGSMAMAPVLLACGMFLFEPAVSRVLAFDNLIDLFLMFLLAAIGGVIGVNKIDFLRRAAFRATQLGQYRLRERIGAGGMGDVFLAEHEMLKRPCVIKLIRPDRVGDERTLARFQREVQATAQLSHWNTVEILDYGRTEDGTLYYVMEYLPGMTLAEMVEKYGPMPASRVIYLLLQVCDALREAHEVGLVHRDVKPENIVVAERGGVFDVAKILDFGLVEPVVDDRDRESSWDGTIAGSPFYMSPEQAAGTLVADPRTDIYSLGAVGYYLLTGSPPFSGDSLVQLVDAHTSEEPLAPSQHRAEISGELDQLVTRCLAKDPADRFQDMSQLGEALSKCEANGRWDRSQAALWWQAREESD